LEYSESTRQALVDSAVELFTKRGYAATSLDEVAKRARVTKGALYHHFSGKQALFEAAFDAVERSTMSKIAEIVVGPGGAWERATTGLRQWFRVCLDPAYQRIVINEAPVVMGWERWREAEEHFSFGLLRAGLQGLIDAGEIEPLPIEAMSRLLFGALSAGAIMIAGAEDQKKANAEVAGTIVRMLESMRKHPAAVLSGPGGHQVSRGNAGRARGENGVVAS
jgi:AcrR family transcriptional regulator